MQANVKGLKRLFFPAVIGLHTHKPGDEQQLWLSVVLMVIRPHGQNLLRSEPEQLLHDMN